MFLRWYCFTFFLCFDLFYDDAIYQNLVRFCFCFLGNIFPIFPFPYSRSLNRTFFSFFLFLQKNEGNFYPDISFFFFIICVYYVFITLLRTKLLNCYNLNSLLSAFCNLFLRIKSFSQKNNVFSCVCLFVCSNVFLLSLLDNWVSFCFLSSLLYQVSLFVILCFCFLSHFSPLWEQRNRRRVIKSRVCSKQRRKRKKKSLLTKKVERERRKLCSTKKLN